MLRQCAVARELQKSSEALGDLLKGRMMPYYATVKRGAGCYALKRSAIRTTRR
jgi:hypothetical protein